MQNIPVEDIKNVSFGRELTNLPERGLIDKKKVYLTVKRMSDVVISGLALVALLPLFLVTAILIKLDSKGPVFLIQERIGKNGKNFKMYKFRSMILGADDYLKEYLKENKEAREEYQKYKKLKSDPRITKVGKFIRKTSIDELPQLINVLIGDMSLIGPRPFLLREKADMRGYYNYIIKSKPGITGYWATNGRNSTTYEERMKLELEYIDNMGMKMDMEIFFKTIINVVKKKGAM